MDFEQIRVYKAIFSCYNIVMKQKIRIIDKITGKILENEIEIRNLDHFETQLKTRANIFRNRKLYTRKVKHKKVEFDDQY